MKHAAPRLRELTLSAKIGFCFLKEYRPASRALHWLPSAVWAGKGTRYVRHEYLLAVVTSPSDDLLRFIGSSFRSVWALELLLILKSARRTWSQDELVSTMRASELVVTNALNGLVSAGLASMDDSGAVYMPVNDEVAAWVEQIEKLYGKRPDAVRRAIVSASASGAAAFADAFRLRKE